MKKEVVPFDLMRMLFGSAPPWFLFEIFLRGLALYLFMLLIIRLLGKRMAGKLTIAEMVLTVTLGASVAVAIQMPEGGVLLGFVVLSCAFLFEKSYSWLTIKSPFFEKLSQGDSCILIRNGVLQLDQIRHTRVTTEQIFAVLRGKNIYHLGKVERLYLESGGSFSIYKVSGTIPPGLPIYPPGEHDLTREQHKATGLKACAECGCTCGEKEADCHSCSGHKWVDAII